MILRTEVTDGNPEHGLYYFQLRVSLTPLKLCVQLPKFGSKLPKLEHKCLLVPEKFSIGTCITKSSVVVKNVGKDCGCSFPIL